MKFRLCAFAKVCSALCTAFFLSGLVLGAPASAWAQVHLNLWTSPSQGFAGTTQVNVTGSGFPSGNILPGSVTITVASSCGGPKLATTTGLKVTDILGSTDRIEFLIPASLSSLASGTIVDVSVAGKTSSGTAFSSTNCSEMKVLVKAAISSCLPSSSLGVLLPAKGPGSVTAYAPNGAWSASNTGIQVVPIEGGGSPKSISTPNTTNSCASNSATGETVCVANNTDVYLITGSTLNTTLTSGSTGFASFSGGTCKNCGVAINGLTNTAVVEMGLAGSPSGGGLQFLNLATKAFSATFPSGNPLSENVQWDPARKLILSPNERGIYDLFNTSAATPTEFGMSIGGDLDSAAEDCTTGIALSTDEFTHTLFITDLTQATFTAGSPGTWTAPGHFTDFPEFGEFAAGTSGIAVAPGSHLALVNGEFGGNQFGVVVLPSTSGSGTPSFGDYVAALLPNTPNGFPFSTGLDPHTLTAYVSPNTGKVVGLIANSPPPTFIAVIDLQALLSAPRKAGVFPNGNVCSGCTHSVDPTYDLIAHGVVRYLATH